MPYFVSGVTRSRVDSSPLATTDVYLLKYNSGTDTFTQIDSDISNGSGEFSLTALDNAAAYTVLAFDDVGSPVLTGITSRNIVPEGSNDFAPTYYYLGF